MCKPKPVILIRVMKNPILTGLAALVLASGAGEVEASTMIFGNPGAPNNGVEFNASTGYILIPFEITNNDLNTEYSGAVVNSTKGSATEPTSGFQGLYDFGGNSTAYSNVEDMLTSITDGKDNVKVGLDGDGNYSAFRDNIDNIVEKGPNSNRIASRYLNFSGYLWSVKNHTAEKVGPGPNYFDPSDEMVGLDSSNNRRFWR